MDPRLWWYLARVGGLMSWWLLSATVVWGLLLYTRVLGPRTTTARLFDLHRFLSVLSLVFLAVHVLALVADSWVDVGLPQLLFPFTSDFRPVAVAWGVIAVYLLLAVEVTSLLRRRIPHRWWRYVHTCAFAVFALGTVHALTAGTDTTVVRWTAVALIAAVVFLAVYRLLAGRRTDDPDTSDDDPRHRPGEDGMAASPRPQAGAATTAVAHRPGREVVVTQLRRAADDVVAVHLAAADGGPLPAWEPGAHIDLVLPSGLIRPYSLCGDPGDRRTYRIAVLHARGGRGGSAEVHALRAGQPVAITGPRNRFPLVLAEYYLFIAGGIGITPIMPMVKAAAAAGLPWRLLYGGRSRAAMAFADELLALGDDRVRLVRQDTDGLPDLAAALAETPSATAVYSCGPEALLTAVQQLITTRFPDRHLHTERFGPPATTPHQATTPSPAGEFHVELHRSGRVLKVPADRSMLDVIRQTVPDVPSSCEQGFCGDCELRVLDGIPDHRDTVLPAGQRHRRDVIYPCVSRAHSPILSVDL
ncbi:Flavodoxin reductases (ferredoxin-NADPH reductases) family 1; Vanillate O-demethylase oxidoreductase [Alloactinosynnema sp. L-07]|uniref:ferric reductase-like transmembrane domain-containing protein n=1 Tax=Alloactinosynnema sp. L-07 TaxID=1653480 RepID=UPI00065EF2FD|nr:2Fe-2S iron-sulfur cluster-binding protein [Alloactinosynnema sp. L-07]CRK55269.1 Flavodoxin reductases (ferredoxin-NADPH reductases) family 1; Vanillate O-demethylase oxidoreductase [Alloactinosynnema sp. L-07]